MEACDIIKLPRYSPVVQLAAHWFLVPGVEVRVLTGERIPLWCNMAARWFLVPIVEVRVLTGEQLKEDFSNYQYSYKSH